VAVHKTTVRETLKPLRAMFRKKKKRKGFI